MQIPLNILLQIWAIDVTGVARADTSHENAATLAMRVPAVDVAAVVERRSDVVVAAVVVVDSEAVAVEAAAEDVVVRIAIMHACARLLTIWCCRSVRLLFC